MIVVWRLIKINKNKEKEGILCVDDALYTVQGLF